MTINQDIVENLNRKAAGTSLDERLRLVRDELEGRLVFTTSFGIEDQVVTQAVAGTGLDIELVTLDTGRLFAETYELWAETEQLYGVRIKPFYPKAELLEPLIAKQGINGFYESLAERKGCCDIRKVEPLARSLAGASAWVTGLRAQHSGADPSTQKVRDLIDFLRSDTFKRQEAALMKVRRQRLR